jgi:hypothetical protein
MEANTNTAGSLHPFISVTGLTDAELLAGTRRVVGRSNQLLAELLAHLGEVETRGIHRTRAGVTSRLPSVAPSSSETATGAAT